MASDEVCHQMVTAPPGHSGTLATAYAGYERAERRSYGDGTQSRTIRRQNPRLTARPIRQSERRDVSMVSNTPARRPIPSAKAAALYGCASMRC